ncbi:MAG: hypothetical protein K8R36_13395 [Planctomycetales bacterium]|nr:hypothetical protein [Planctomycetales bacterium]
MVISGTLLAFLGCGGGGFKAEAGVKVTGKVTKGGQPLKASSPIPGIKPVRIELFPIHTGPEDSRSAFGTLVNEDGTFELDGPGQGIKPGKYKVSVTIDSGDGNDQLGGKYAGMNSPIEIEIAENKKGGSQDLGAIAIEP